MRILFAITLGEVGGAQEHLKILATGLTTLGHHVGVVVQVPSKLAHDLEQLGLEVHPWADITRNPNPVRDLRARRQLRRAVRRFRPDVLHLYSSKAGLLGRGLVRPPSGVTIFTCHHAPYGPRRRLAHRLIGRPLDQLTLPALDGIISDGARDIPLLRKLAPKVPIRLVRNAIAVDGPPAGAEPNETALWVARLQHPKDPLLAIRAWERVVRERPHARLIMCGTGPLEAEVRSRWERSPARDQIELLGMVPDLHAQHARSSVFLLTTSVEGGITMATLEALSHGIVPVLSDAGDAFLLEHARCGVVVQPGSAKAHAEAILGLLGNPDRVGAMSCRAIEFGRSQWTTDDLVKETADFYDEVRTGSGSVSAAR